MENLFKINCSRVIFVLFFVIVVAFNKFAHASNSGNKFKKGKVVLSITQAISMAFKNNRSVIIAEQNLDVAKAMCLASKSNFLPKVGVNFAYSYRDAVMNMPVSRYSSDKDIGIFLGYTHEKLVNFYIAQSIFEGGKDISMLHQAQMNLLIQKQRLENAKQVVEFEVKRLFYGLLLAQQIRQIALDLLEQAKAHYKIVKQKYEAGVVSRFDLLRSRVQISKVYPELIKAENSEKLIRSKLKRVLGISSSVKLELKGKLRCNFIALNESEFLNLAYKNNAELKIQALKKKVGREQILIAKSIGRPKVRASINYSYKSDSINDMFNSRHNNWSAMLSINLPLFDGFLAASKVAEAKAKYRELNTKESDLRDKIRVEVRKAILALSEAQAIIRSQQDSLLQAKEALKIAEARYKNGSGTNLDVLDAQVSLSQIRINFSQGVYDYLVALAYLEKIIGKRLFMED